MTDKTATQNLTRTTSSDDPKQTASYLRSLGTDVDQRMTSQYFDLGRSQVPPFAVVRIEAPFLVANPSVVGTGDQLLFYDTVAVDTAGMVDLSQDNAKIFLNEPGYYICGCYMQSNGFGQGASPNDTYVKLISSTGTNFANTAHDNGTGLLGVGGSTMVQVTSPNVASIFMRTGYSGSTGGPAMLVLFAELWAYKCRDL